jgi:hypothetical protein
MDLQIGFVSLKENLTGMFDSTIISVVTLKKISRGP